MGDSKDNRGTYTVNSLDGERTIYAACTAVWYMVVGRFVQLLGAREEAREKTARFAGFSNGLSRSEGFCVFSMMRWVRVVRRELEQETHLSAVACPISNRVCSKVNKGVKGGKYNTHTIPVEPIAEV